MIFIKTLQKMLKQNLTIQITIWIDHYQKEKNKKVISVMKDELGEKIMKEFVGLRAKTYSYLIKDGSEDEKAKETKKNS